MIQLSIGIVKLHSCLSKIALVLALVLLFGCRPSELEKVGINNAAKSATTSSLGLPVSDNVLSPTEIIPMGRTAINPEKGLELISAASNFGFSFTGKTCTIYLSITEWTVNNYLQYEMDGVYQKKIRINYLLNNQPIVITAPNDGTHTMRLYKTTEPGQPIYISKVIADNIKPLTERRRHFIEFIGNSITCGAASDESEVPCNVGLYQDQANAYYAYGPRVARALDTDYMLTSVSGIGVYRNYQGNTGPTMPQAYEKTNLQDTTYGLWNFSTYTPDIVSIGLGTNDMSEGDGVVLRLPFDSTEFVNRYVNFIHLVKSKNPKARILLLSSPMVGGARGALLQNCLTAVKTQVNNDFPNQKPVTTYFFKPISLRGCGGHPSVADNVILAEELIPVYQKLLH